MIEVLQVLDQHRFLEDERSRQVTYLDRPHERQVQTLILCETNRDRQVITDQIRAAHLEQGKLGQASRTIQSLQPKRLDERAIAQAFNYEVGDVVRFCKPSQKFPSLYFVVGV